MTIDQIRKNYPFISYGNQYAHWKNTVLYYKYLLDRITKEPHASEIGHDWNKWSATFYCSLRELSKLLAKLPKPTKDQIKNEDDPNYPWIKGKWPEKSMPQIRLFCKSYEEVKECAVNVAAILTLNEYYVKVMKSKTYPSKNWSNL